MQGRSAVPIVAVVFVHSLFTRPASHWVRGCGLTLFVGAPAQLVPMRLDIHWDNSQVRIVCGVYIKLIFGATATINSIRCFNMARLHALFLRGQNRFLYVI